jgi:hypothetical protein
MRLEGKLGKRHRLEREKMVTLLHGSTGSNAEVILVFPEEGDWRASRGDEGGIARAVGRIDHIDATAVVLGGCESEDWGSRAETGLLRVWTPVWTHHCGTDASRATSDPATYVIAITEPGRAGRGVVLFDWSREDYERFLADPQSREIMASAGLQRPPEHTVLEPVGETGS